MISWLTDKLGTASFYAYEKNRPDFPHRLVDVRNLVDKEGNRASSLLPFVQETFELFQSGERVIVCCDMGISRSNTVALGALLLAGMSYKDALILLGQRVGIENINLGLLRSVRASLEIHAPNNRVRDKSVLVTGAGGYIGRKLISSLGDNFHFLAPHRSDLNFALDPPLLEAWFFEEQPDLVLHLAHPRMRHCVSAMSEAVSMTKNLLECCRFFNTPFVYVSSLAVFSGYKENRLTVDASVPARPAGTYGESKFLCENLVQLYRTNYGLGTTVLRPAGVYGPGMDEWTFVHKFSTAALQGKPIVTHRYANGRPAFDLLYIDDLILAIKRVIESPPPGVLHLGTGNLVSTNDVARTAINILNSNSSLSEKEIDGETYHVAISPREAETEMGWRAATCFVEGMGKVLQATHSTETRMPE